MERITGIIGAMDEEVAKLIAQADITATENIAGMVFHVGRLGGADVIIVRSGMGKVNAGICTQLLISARLRRLAARLQKGRDHNRNGRFPRG